MLNYKAKTFTYPKKGNAESENEDAFILTYPDEDNIIRIAVSDGATESSFSKEWAELIVRYYAIYNFENETFFQLLYPSLRRQWLDEVNTQDLPWYAQEKLEIGAFATLLGASISTKSGECNISAIGDSNLFIYRDEKVILRFPIKNASDFGSSPFLLSSVLERNKRADRFFFSEELYSIKNGDLVVIGTDAICQWILLQEENKISTYQVLLSLYTEKLDFDNWLNEQRIENKIKNDDTTLVFLKFE